MYQTREERAAERTGQRAVGKELGKRIDQAGLTRRAVATHMGVDEGQFSRWMHGIVRWQAGVADFRATVNAAIDELTKGDGS